MDWADELAASVEGPQVVNDSKTPSGTVHVGSLRGPVILDVDHPGPARPRPRDDAPLRRRRPRPDGRPGAPEPGRDRARDGPPARPRARPGRRLPRALRAPLRGHLHRHVRRPGHRPGPLLLDERHLPDGRDGPVHPHRARQGRRRPRGLPPRGQRPAPGPLAAAGRDLPELRQGRDDDRLRLGRRDRQRRVQAGPRRSGRPAAAGPGGSARSAARPSCPGTWSGPRSGACSA